MPMHQPIVGFHADEQGDWVAELACGHTQHVRHKPPFQLRAWVTTVEGRAAHVGAVLACPKCDMPQLPADVTHYRSTPDFDAQSLPEALKQSHRLRAGTWGKIVVAEGLLLYAFEDGSSRAFVLSPGFPGIVVPELPHRVEPRGDVRFHIEFHH